MPMVTRLETNQSMTRAAIRRGQEAYSSTKRPYPGALADSAPMPAIGPP